MTLQVTPGMLLAFGFALGTLFGSIAVAFIFIARIKRVLTIFRLGIESAALLLAERVPQITATLGRLGVTAAVAELTTGIVNDLTRGAGYRIKACAERKRIGFHPEADEENQDGR